MVCEVRGFASNINGDFMKTIRLPFLTFALTCIFSGSALAAEHITAEMNEINQAALARATVTAEKARLRNARIAVNSRKSNDPVQKTKLVDGPTLFKEHGRMQIFNEDSQTRMASGIWAVCSDQRSGEKVPIPLRYSRDLKTLPLIASGSLSFVDRRRVYFIMEEDGSGSVNFFVKDDTKVSQGVIKIGQSIEMPKVPWLNCKIESRSGSLPHLMEQLNTSKSKVSQQERNGYDGNLQDKTTPPDSIKVIAPSLSGDRKEDVAQKAAK